MKIKEDKNPHVYLIMEREPENEEFPSIVAGVCGTRKKAEAAIAEYEDKSDKTEDELYWEIEYRAVT
jgi:hypothetical protein